MRADTDQERTEYIHGYLFDHTQEVLDLAATYQAFGLSYQLQRTKGQTPLDIDKLYQLPPLSEEASTFTILPLSEHLVDTARRYRAHKRWLWLK